MNEEPEVKAEAEEETKTIIGPDGEPMEVTELLTLGVEKFRRPVKHYRLIWILLNEAWLAEAEEPTWFRQQSAVVEAGQALAAKYDVKFSEITR